MYYGETFLLFSTLQFFFVLRLIIKITNTIQRGYFHPICGQLGGFQSEYLLINANLHAMDVGERIPGLGVGTVGV